MNSSEQKCDWKSLKILTISLLAVATVAVNALADEGEGASGFSQSVNQGPRIIQGVWDSVVTIQPCGSDLVLRKFRALNLFERDGSLIATSEIAQPPSLGKWLWLGDRKYRAMFRFQRFGAGTGFEGVNEVVREIELDSGAATFTSTVTITVFDTFGVQLAKTCAKEIATRVY